jgi:hypothetical protein
MAVRTMLMNRNFECPATGSPCERPQCKKSLCILEGEVVRRANERFAAEAAKIYKGEIQITVPRTPTDRRVDREARRVALEKVKRALKRKGVAISSVPKDKMNNFIKSAIAKYPDIMDEARRRVNAGGEIAT